MRVIPLKYFVGLLAFLVLQGCAVSYSANSIRARVVDAETKLPIAGVNVVASWVSTKRHFGIHGSSSHYVVAISEAVTDEDGWFHFPAWGPSAIPPGVPPDAFISTSDPHLQLFKSGHDFRSLFNRDRGNDARHFGVRRASDWDGKTIELGRYAGTRASYADRLNSSRWHHRGVTCQYKKTPRMLVALEREAEALKREGVRHSIRRLSDLERIAETEHCGSVEQFFAPYLK